MANEAAPASTTDGPRGTSSTGWSGADEWEDSWWAKSIEPKKRLAARLVGEDVDDARIEDLLGLKRGELTEWVENDPGFVKAAKAALLERMESEPQQLDFSAVLTPKQMKATELRFVGLQTQVQVARAVGVTDRTVRTWFKDPVVLEYGRRLQQAAMLERMQESKQREISLKEKRDAQVAKAQDVVEKALDREDEKVALAILRPFLTRGR